MEIKIKSRADIIKVQSVLLDIMADVDKGKIYDCEIKQHREKRSKNANDYSWVLQDKIAKETGRSLSDIHKQMVLDYGVIETYSIKKQAFDSAKRMFDYYEVLGESSVKGVEFVHVKAALGTHLYNTKEMSTFIDGVIQEAQQLGIETKTPEEIAKLISLWKEGEMNV